jgi:hypothetical protein
LGLRLRPHSPQPHGFEGLFPPTLLGEPLLPKDEAPR